VSSIQWDIQYFENVRTGWKRLRTLTDPGVVRELLAACRIDDPDVIYRAVRRTITEEQEPW
jgi:hypothetical protein